MFNRRVVSYTLAVLLCVSAGSRLIAEPSPALTPDLPFADSPAALRAAAEAAVTTKPEDAVVLLREVTVHLDSDGRWTSLRRNVVHLRSASGVKSWAMLTVPWRPWHQKQPELKARVVTTSGEEHWLDPATVGETPRYDNNNVLSDWRSQRAPLPAVAAGAVIETVVRVEDEEPFFAGGLVESYWIERPEPVKWARFRVEAPKGANLRFDLGGLSTAAPVQETRGESEHWLFELFDVEPHQELPSHLPPEVRRWPGFSLTNGDSWGDVARRYSGSVEAQLEGMDLGGVVKEVLAGVGERDEKIRRLVEWLHREVRYTGLEFGEAAFVPRKPSEVLARKYGDCKDKASLLAALLRTAGIPAHLALLRAGSVEDVLPELPGLGGFDHAILYVPGPPELWIDATAEHTRVGELPPGAVDRWALVAAPHTNNLVKTPPPSPDTSVVREVEEVRLLELGPAEIDSAVTFRGPRERQMRAGLLGIGEQRMVEEMKKRGLADFFNARLLDLDFEGWESPRAELTMRLTMDQAKLFKTELDVAEVEVSNTDFTSYLPAAFSPKSAEERGQGGKENEPPRSADWYLNELPAVESTYRVRPPPGYVATELPEPTEEQWGPLAFERTYQRQPDQTVVVTTRARFTQHRFSAAKGEELKAALSKLLDGKRTTLRFEHVGEAHLAAGRIEEAILELRRLVAAAPDKALPLARLARAYAEAGLGELARAEAARATALEPESAIAWQSLGLVLMRDLLGRHQLPGWDPEGAEAAHRKASELEPDNLLHAWNLGITLEHMATGWRYQPGPRLEQAMSLYRSAQEKDAVDDDVDLGKPLLATLVRAERFTEVEELARERAATEADYAALAVAVAASRGSAEAIDEMKPINDPEQRRSVLRQAGFELYQLRRYRLASDLFAAAAKGASGSDLLSQAELLGRTTAHEQMTLAPDNPLHWVVRLLKPHFLPGQADEDILVRIAEASGHDAAVYRERLATERRRRDADVLADSTPPAALFDLALAQLETALDEGLGGGQRVRFRVGEDPWDVLYLRREGDHFEPIALGQLGVEPLGEEAARQLEAGNLEAARSWLDWAREVLPDPVAGEPFSASGFSRLWSVGKTAPAEEVHLAASTLRVSGAKVAGLVKTLEKALAVAATEEDRLAIRLAVRAALIREEDYSRALELTEEILGPGAASESSFQALVGHYTSARQFDRPRQLAEERLRQKPRDPMALRVLIGLAYRDGRYGEAVELSNTLLSTGRTVNLDYNNTAWYHLMAGTPDDKALALARRAVELAENEGELDSQRAALNTVAALLVELGRPTEALQALLEGLSVDGYAPPELPDWLVIGRIAEHYGLAETAAAMYQKVAQDTEEDGRPSSSSVLAKRWLERVQAAGKGGSKGGVRSPFRKPVEWSPGGGW